MSSELNPNLKVISQLGKGQYGYVYKCEDIKTNKIVAVKELKLGKNILEKFHPNYQRQITLARGLNHPNLLNLIRDQQWDDKVYIVSEYCNEGDLTSFLQRKRIKGTAVDSEEAWSLFKDLLNGLEYLHANKLMHRDLKPDNVFLHRDQKTGKLIAKIGDYGMVKKEQSALNNTFKVGTPLYSSANVLKGRGQYSSKCDVFSLGLVLYYILFGKHLFKDARDISNLLEMQYKQLRSESIAKVVAGMVCDDKFKEIFVRALAYEEARRPTAAELKEWVREMEAEQTEVMPGRSKIKTSTNISETENVVWDQDEMSWLETLREGVEKYRGDVRDSENRYLSLVRSLHENLEYPIDTHTRLLLMYLIQGFHLTNLISVLQQAQDPYSSINGKLINWNLAEVQSFKPIYYNFLESIRSHLELHTKFLRNMVSTAKKYMKFFSQKVQHSMHVLEQKGDVQESYFYLSEYMKIVKQLKLPEARDHGLTVKMMQVFS